MAPENTPRPPAEDAPPEQIIREAAPEAVPAEDRARIAEEASRQEDA